MEIVVFLRAVKSRTFFEQMKGRGVRVIKPDDLKAVTPDVTTKDHFVIVDTIGVCEQDKTDAHPMEKKPSVAGRLARMEHRITKEDEQAISKASGGLTLKDLSRRLVEAVNPDRHTPYDQSSQVPDKHNWLQSAQEERRRPVSVQPAPAGWMSFGGNTVSTCLAGDL